METQQAFIYCRISQDRSGEGLGVQRQEEDCRALAAQQGLAVARVFIDNDISAYSGKRRPEYEAMLSLLEAGAASAVICWHTDRLHRRPVELERYIDVCNAANVTTHAVKSGELDLATGSGKMVARMLGAAARYESDQKGERIKRAIEQKARAGKWTGGARPFGWVFEDGVPIICETEAAVVRGAFEHVLGGRTLGSWVREINAAGITTSLGKPWGYTQLRQVIQRPRNAGLATLHGEVIGLSEFPAIVSESVWQAACSILSDPARRRSQSNKAVHLLSGIAQCHCGALVRVATVSGRDGVKHKVYRCPVRGKGHIGKRVEYTDAVVNRLAVAFRAMAASQQEVASPALAAELQTLELEGQALRQRLQDAAHSYADGDISPAQLSAITERIRDNQTRVTARVTELEVQAARPARPTDGLPTAEMDSPEAITWLTSPADDRRDYIRATMNVIIWPHGKGSKRVFDPETVQTVMKNAGDGLGPLSVREIQHAGAAVLISSKADMEAYIATYRTAPAAS
ncbi:recombinase family protein [Arthrobacter sp. A5]|uniref:recombinase family protein n=1 Tax=Arthrobacter sp. A5 TaxID=576926 RepID=UPI003DA8A7E3